MKACVFSYEELSRDSPLYPPTQELSGQEYQTTAFLKERLEELGIRILESGLKTGLIAEIESGQPWWHLSRYRCPSNFGTNESALPKSESRSHACMWPWFSSNQSSGQQLFSRKKDQLEEPYAWSSASRRNLRRCFWCLATGLLEDVQELLVFTIFPS